MKISDVELLDRAYANAPLIRGLVSLGKGGYRCVVAAWSSLTAKMSISMLELMLGVFIGRVIESLILAFLF